MLSDLGSLVPGYKIPTIWTSTDLIFRFKPTLLTDNTAPAIAFSNTSVLTLLTIISIHITVLDDECIVKVTQKSPIHPITPPISLICEQGGHILKTKQSEKVFCWSFGTNKIPYTSALLCSKYLLFGGFGWDVFGSFSSLIKSNEQDQ